MLQRLRLENPLIEADHSWSYMILVIVLTIMSAALLQKKFIVVRKMTGKDISKS